MTLSEYLDRLRKALGPMESAERDDFIREMESHVVELRERHPEATDEEIIGGLTPPESLAEELLGEGPNGMDSRSEETRTGETRRGPETGKEDGFRRVGPAEQLRSALETLSRLGELGRIHPPHAPHLPHPPHAPRPPRPPRAPRFGSDEDWGDEGEFEKEFADEAIDEVRVSVFSAEVVIHTSDTAGLRVRVSGEDLSNRLQLLLDAGILELKEREAGGEPLEEVELWIPSGVEVVEIRTKTGDVSGEGIEGGQVAIVTASGDVELSGIEANCSVETASGDISVEGCGSLSAKSSSGDIEVEGAEGDVAATSSSGDVRIEEGSGRAGVETASGDIEIRAVEGRVGAKSVSGSVSIADCPDELGVMTTSGSLEIKCGEDFGAIAASTVSGDLSLRLPGDPDAEIRAVTKSGSARIGERRGSKLDVVLGSGGAEIRLSSLSGDIEVEW